MGYVVKDKNKLNTEGYTHCKMGNSRPRTEIKQGTPATPAAGDENSKGQMIEDTESHFIQQGLVRDLQETKSVENGQLETRKRDRDKRQR